VCTRFNALLGSLCVVVLVVRSPSDALFGLVVVTNAFIGIVQETRAKRTLDSLAFLHRAASTVVRDGEVHSISTDDIVLDDIMLLKSGDRIPADGVVIESHQLEVDESNLTGESEPVAKSVGDSVLSGCGVVAGGGFFRATTVGASAYANSLSTEARVFRRTPSEIQRGLDTVLRWVGWVILVAIPLQIVAVVRLDQQSLRSGILRSVAGLVGVVPEGLVLLSTLAFFSAALSLSKQQVLVQELNAVEGLARVDVVCIDKTGTLTTGTIEFGSCEILAHDARHDIASALGALASDTDRNSTLQAVHEAYPDIAQWTTTHRIPFDSNRKWKASAFDGHGTWYLGAPEMLAPHDERVMVRVNQLAGVGNRVLLLCRSRQWMKEPRKSDDIESMALVVLRERIRVDARDTLKYLESQGVRVVVVSGDNPATVSAIAHEVGIESTNAIDARTLGDDSMAIDVALEQSSIFGRVSPMQKREMVHALQTRGHVVAMTGDGVNDSLALKRADVGIAMGNATPATKAVAQFVLLDSSFSSFPLMLGEGRRVIANIERVAQLFLAKNAMSFVAIVVGAVSATGFPVMPRQMTFLSTLTIGVPAFFLALAPNSRRFSRGFVSRIVSRSVPIGVAIGISVVMADRITGDSSGAAASITALICFFFLLLRVAQPLTMQKTLLIFGLACIATVCVAAPVTRDFLGFDTTISTLAVAGACCVPAIVAIGATTRPTRSRNS
jgi:cation-transporting ATPase E